MVVNGVAFGAYETASWGPSSGARPVDSFHGHPTYHILRVQPLADDLVKLDYADSLGEAIRRYKEQGLRPGAGEFIVMLRSGWTPTYDGSIVVHPPELRGKYLRRSNVDLQWELAPFQAREDLGTAPAPVPLDTSDTALGLTTEQRLQQLQVFMDPTRRTAGSAQQATTQAAIQRQAAIDWAKNNAPWLIGGAVVGSLFLAFALGARRRK